ncbi:hypothetical protein ACP70R_035300 [Stipagrostis hirtigluma subsp. patula]
MLLTPSTSIRKQEGKSSPSYHHRRPSSSSSRQSPWPSPSPSPNPSFLLQGRAASGRTTRPTLCSWRRRRGTGAAAGVRARATTGPWRCASSAARAGGAGLARRRQHRQQAPRRQWPSLHPDVPAVQGPRDQEPQGRKELAAPKGWRFFAFLHDRGAASGDEHRGEVLDLDLDDGDAAAEDDEHRGASVEEGGAETSDARGGVVIGEASVAAGDDAGCDAAADEGFAAALHAQRVAATDLLGGPVPKRARSGGPTPTLGGAGREPPVKEAPVPENAGGDADTSGSATADAIAAAVAEALRLPLHGS